jgi:hypothetical protein
VRLDSNTVPFLPSMDRPGVDIKPLFQDAHEDVRLERWKPNAAIELTAAGGAEFLVLEGGFTEAGDSFGPQSWLRVPAGYALRATAGANGCKLWVKTGHLQELRSIAR